MNSSRLRIVPLMAVAMMGLVAWTACTSNPTKTAATATADNKADTIAFAIYAQYVVVEELAADIKEAPGTPQAVKDALKAASLASAPAAESLKDGADTVNGIRAVIAAGQECGPPKPDGKKLCAADFPAKLAELNSLLTDTAPKLKRLTDAYNASKRITR